MPYSSFEIAAKLKLPTYTVVSFGFSVVLDGDGDQVSGRSEDAGGLPVLPAHVSVQGAARRPRV